MRYATKPPEPKKSPKLKIYLAGAFFNEHQRAMIVYAAQILRQMGHQVFVPMEHEVPDANDLSNHDWGEHVFCMDFDAILDCECVVAVYEGMDSDTGTAWEIGAAYALKKPIICIHMGTEKASLMVTTSATANLHRISDLLEYDFQFFPYIPYDREVQ